MGQRFGGEFSNGGATDGAREAIDMRKVARSGRGAFALFLPAVLLAFLSLFGGAVELLTGLAGAAILTLSAWLTREGMQAATEFDLRKVARKPALPRKMIATALMGVGIFVTSLSNDPSMLAAILYGIVAAGLHTVAFGIDPLRDKRMEGIDTFQQDRVAKVVDEAETYLASMSGHIASIGDRHLETRTAAFQTAARRMIRTVEEDPRDLTGARKFLGVYLMGARDAAAKFADLYKRQRNEDARADFEALLSDLEQNFAARTEKMLLDDRSDMDIEIKVLRDRLQREGL